MRCALRRLSICISLFVATASFASPALAGAKITMSYDFVETEVSPHHAASRTHLKVAYQLSSDNTVSYSSSQGTRYVIKLGQTLPETDPTGVPFTVSFGVIDGAMTITGEWPSFISAVRITTDGKTSCTATREWRRKPGHQFFEVKRMRDRQPMLDSDMHAEHIVCSIESTPG
jgi:hypothetical protein